MTNPGAATAAKCKVQPRKDKDMKSEENVTADIDAAELIETASIYRNRAGETVQEHEAISMWIDGEKVGTDEELYVDAYTTNERIEEIAKDIAVSAGTIDGGAEEVFKSLREKQASFQLNDDQWGNLTPYLEQLLTEEHPNIRLKTAGKYNPEGRRIILIRTRPGDGGWEPAAIDDGKKAWNQWRSAGLEYPFADSREGERSRDVLTEIETRIDSQAVISGRSTVTEALSQYRKLIRKIEMAQEEVDQLVPVIRENNLEEAEIKVREYRNAMQEDIPVTGALKARKALIETVLKAISADNQIDTENPDYLPFARIASMIELGIGRSSDRHEVEKDDKALCEAAGFSRVLLSQLREDRIGNELRPVLERALILAEGGSPD